jgi:tetratricopeptide (TPR) repeat protein
LALCVCFARPAAAATDKEHSAHAAMHSSSARPSAGGENLGTYHRAIGSKSPEAQAFFDRGLRLKYAFNVEAAQRAFEDATKADSTCAICWWGVALTLGHDINLPPMPERETAAYAASQKAVALASRASRGERALIEALAKRFAATPAADPNEQAARDQAYADAMREVATQFPADDDAAVLYAEAIMNQHPWNWWTKDYKPEAGTLDAIAAIERVLKRHPMHPGANHFYIHAVEESDHPEKALPSAERLRTLVPDGGHLVHMPSHIYQLLGRYADGMEANRKAVAADKAYFAKVGDSSPIYTVYLAHNYHFLSVGAMMAGRMAEAVEAARGAAASPPLEMLRMMPGMDFFLTAPYHALVRSARWDDLVKEPAPPAGFPYTSAIWHYARGLALAANGQLDDAAHERDSVAAIAAVTPEEATEAFSSARTLLAVASHTLEGAIAARRGDKDAAIQHLEEAVKAEDTLHYDEPPDWPTPSRHVLGGLLLDAGRAVDAETVYREDLKHHPENGWALAGLANSLRAQNKSTEAANVDARLTKASVGSDIAFAPLKF